MAGGGEEKTGDNRVVLRFQWPGVRGDGGWSSFTFFFFFFFF